ncbi:hypothetical protein [Microlunatus soli]|uniref:Uncharacterized protein n=1 Tax=Microlunatus soli TaxID=630515 RepID=A0A1H1XD27_9ACTN|nr:hypothetical protein [Microlunatus soli]SDT07205.1 hypothetical protein SAMN04489812_4033 [Microlunatus soli]
MADLKEDVSALLPLVVTGVATNCFMINMYGEGWALAVNCAWALARHGRVLATWESDDDLMLAVVEGQRGRSVVAMEIDEGVFDPIFHFDDGTVLTVEADTEIDPWTFRAKDLPVVLVGVGPLSYQDWLDAQGQR